VAEIGVAVGQAVDVGTVLAVVDSGDAERTGR
jgi:pyruvate/2-oxoglutarate dehydrogenase complex dihydrolipoamide acyltransferase (E2) component